MGKKQRKQKNKELGRLIWGLALAILIACATVLSGGGTAWSQAKAAPFSYNPAGRRDPFKPLIESKKEAEKTTELEEDLSKRPPLQRFDLSSLKLVGIIWGSLGRHALVETPDGKGYLISPKSLLGRNKGEVTAINEDNIVIEEKFRTALGKTDTKTLIIKLKKKEG